MSNRVGLHSIIFSDKFAKCRYFIIHCGRNPEAKVVRSWNLVEFRGRTLPTWKKSAVILGTHDCTAE
jgi:hypothetical protein